MIRFIIYPTFLAMLFAGCVKRDLEIRVNQPDGYAEIALDWGSHTHPQSAHYLFYDESGKLVKEAIGVTDSFKGALPAGKYRVVVHNEDAINVGYRGLESHATAEVFVLPIENRSGRQSSKEISYIQEPQQVFGTGVCKEFEQLVIEPDKTTYATVSPELLTRQVQFIFEVKGSEDIRSLEGVLEGVTSGVLLSTGMYNSVSDCSLEFTATPQNRAAAEFVANVGVFNLLTTVESPAETNTISIVLIEDDDTQHNATFDLTEALMEIIGNNDGVIPIEIPVEVILEIKPIEGLTATVRPWDNSGTGGGDPRPTASTQKR